jgi:hypothetical protein
MFGFPGSTLTVGAERILFFPDFAAVAVVKR